MEGRFAADAFGNALGNSIVGAIKNSEAEKQRAAEDTERKADLQRLITQEEDERRVGDLQQAIAQEEDGRRVADLQRLIGAEEDQRRVDNLNGLIAQEEDGRRVGDLNREIAAEESTRKSNRNVAALNARQARGSVSSGDVPFYLDPNSAGKWSFKEASMMLRQQQDAETRLSLTGGAEMSAFTPRAEASLSAYDKFSPWAHGVLTAGGMIPGVGIIPDVLDYGLTAIEIPFGKSTSLDLGLAGFGILGTAAPGTVDLAAGAAKITARAANAEGVAKSAGQLGREGEALAGQITGVGKNTEAWVVNGRTRIPDQVVAQDIATRNPLSVVEVKNVQYQPFTRQLRDYADLVGPGGRVDVMLPPSARVSGPLQRAFDDPFSPLNRRDLVP